jgi:succinyl-diaminopimelate desuccinylase
MMDFLRRLRFANDDVNEFISFYNDHIGFELDGASLGCGFSDPESGKLVFNTGMIDMDGEAARLTLNIRYPVTMDENMVYGAMTPVINKYDLGVVKIKHQAPIYFPKDSTLVKTLMGIYRKHTGDHKTDAVVIGGGTYARAAGNLVAFGACFPGDEETFHKKNEYIEIDKMVLAAKIYADAIYELSKPDPQIYREKKGI